MKYANEKYITLKHPITGDSIIAIPTGKTRQRQSPNKEVEAEVRVITPKSNLDILWINKEQLVKTEPYTSSSQT